MNTRILRSFGFPALLLGLAVAPFAAAQDSGPMPPAPVNASQSSQSASKSAAATQAPASAKTAPAGPAMAKIEVPPGTHIPLILHNAISTRSAEPGDPVYFETSFPVLLDGRVVIPAGSYVSGEVTEAKRPGRIHRRGQLMIRLTTLILPNAYIVKLNGVPGGSPGTGGNESMDKEGKITGPGDKGQDAGTVINTTATGAGLGAAVGAAEGDIGRGAGIGAGVGAAAGLAAILFTRGPEAQLPRGSTLDAVLDRPLYLDASKVKFTSPGESSAIPGPPNREPQPYRGPF